MDQPANNQIPEPLIEAIADDSAKASPTLEPIVNCRDFLSDVLAKLEGKRPKISRLTLILAAILLFITTSTAFLLYQKDASALQILLSCLGEVFLSALVAISGLVDLKSTKNSVVKQVIRDELKRVEGIDRDLRRLAETQIRWQEDLNASKKKLDHGQQEVDDQNEHLASLNVQFFHLQASIEATTETNEAAQSEFNTIRESIGQENARLQIVHQQRCEAEIQLENARVEFDLLLSQNASRIREVAQQEEKAAQIVDELKQERSKLEANKQRLTDDNDALQQTRFELEQHNAKLSGEVDLASEAADELRKTIEELSRTGTDLSAKIDELNERRTEGDRELETVVDRSKAANEKLTELVETRDQLVKEIDRQHSCLAELKKDSDVVNESNCRIARATESLRRKSKKFRERVSNQRKAQLAYSDQICQMQSDLDRLQQLDRDVEESRNQMLASNNRLKDSMHVELNSLQQNKINIENEILSLNTDLNDLASRRLEIEGQVEALEASMKSSSQEEQALAAKKDILASQCRDYELRLETLQGTTEQLEQTQDTVDELDELNEQIVVRTSELASLDRKIAESRERMQQIDLEMEESRNEILASNHSLQVSMQDELNSLQQNKLTTENEIRLLNTDLKDLTSRRLEIEDQVEALEATRRCEQESFDHVQEELDLSTKKLDAMRNEQHQLTVSADTLRMKEVALKQSVEDLVAKRREQMAVADQANEDLQNLQSQVEKLRDDLAERDRVRLQLLKLSEEKNKIDSQIDSKREELETLGFNINEKKALCEDLAAQNQQLQLTTDELTKSVSDLEMEITELTSQSKRSLQALQESEHAEERLATLSETIEQAERELSSIGQSIMNTEGKLKKREIEMNETEAQLKSTREEFASCRNEIKLIEQEKAKRSATIVELEDAAEVLRNEVAELQTEVTELSSAKLDLECARQERIDLEKSIRSTDLQLEKLQNEVQDLALQRENSAEQLAMVAAQSAESEQHRLDNERAAQLCLQQVSRLNDQKKTIVSELGSIEQEVERLNKQINDFDQTIQEKSKDEDKLTASIEKLKVEQERWQESAKEVEQLKEGLELLKSEERAMHEALLVNEQELHQSAQRLDEIEATTATAEAEMRKAKERVDHAEKAAANSEFQVNEMRRRLEELMLEERAAQKRLESIADDASASQRSFNNQRNEETLNLEAAQQELAELLEKLSATKDRASIAKADLEKHEAEVLEAQQVSLQWDSYLQAIKSDCRDLEGVKSKLEDEIANATSRRDQASKDLAAIQNESSGVEGRVESAQRELQEIQSQLSGLNEQHVELKAMLASTKSSKVELDDELRKNEAVAAERSAEVDRLKSLRDSKESEVNEIETRVTELLSRATGLQAEISSAESRKQQIDESIALQTRELEEVKQDWATEQKAAQTKLEEQSQKHAEALAAEQELLRSIEKISEDMRGLRVAEPTTENQIPTATREPSNIQRSEIPQSEVSSRKKQPDPWAQVFDL